MTVCRYVQLSKLWLSSKLNDHSITMMNLQYFNHDEFAKL